MLKCPWETALLQRLLGRKILLWKACFFLEIANRAIENSTSLEKVIVSKFNLLLDILTERRVLEICNLNDHVVKKKGCVCLPLKNTL